MEKENHISLKERTFYPFNRIFKFILANLVLSFFIMLAFMGDPFTSTRIFFIAWSWSLAICATQWLGHGYIFAYLDRKISWIEKPVTRALWGLLALVVYSAVAFYIIQTLFYFLVNGHLPNATWYWFLGNVIYPVAISFVITIIFTSIGFFRAWKASFIKAEKLNTEMLAYKYEVLRNQINPHFLFNSFNVLSDLVYENQDLAVKFIQQLSKLFRYVLDSRDKELVPLKDEMEFVKSFAYLLEIRFENKLKIHIDVPVDDDELIVPVSIQMLIENAVKHNEVSQAFPLTISIRKQDDYIEVINSLKVKEGEGESTEMGIDNLQQQFGYFTDKNITIQKTSEQFQVKLPIIRSQKS